MLPGGIGPEVPVPDVGVPGVPGRGLGDAGLATSDSRLSRLPVGVLGVGVRELGSGAGLGVMGEDGDEESSPRLSSRMSFMVECDDRDVEMLTWP